MDMAAEAYGDREDPINQLRLMLLQIRRAVAIGLKLSGA